MSALVLNTRSKNQAGEFTALLQNAKFDVLEIPALEISKLNFSNQVVVALEELDSSDIVAVTSANAAIFVGEDPRVRQLLKNTTVAAVGTKTGAMLRQNGIAVQLQSAQSNSEELADLIAAQRPKKVLYLSGIPNTGTLKDKLAGISDFIEIPVYTSAPSATLSRDIAQYKVELEKVDYLVFLSREALLAFDYAAESVGKTFKDRPCIVISNRVADAARELGYKKIFISQAQLIEGIVTLLVSL